LTNPGKAPVQPAPAAGAAKTAAPSSSLGIRLWEILPIDSNAFGALLSGAVEGLGKQPPSETQPIPLAPGEKGAATHSFGGFDGSFNAKIVDENSRINVQNLDNVGAAPLTTLIQLRAM